MRWHSAIRAWCAFTDAGVMGIDINGMVQIRDYEKLNNITLRQTAENSSTRRILIATP